MLYLTAFYLSPLEEAAAQLLFAALKPALAQEIRNLSEQPEIGITFRSIPAIVIPKDHHGTILTICLYSRKAVVPREHHRLKEWGEHLHSVAYTVCTSQQVVLTPNQIGVLLRDEQGEEVFFTNGEEELAAV